GCQGEAQGVAQALRQAAEVLRRVPDGPRGDRALGQAQLDVGDDQLRVDLLLDAQPRALRARAVGRVEGERARLEVVEGERVAVGAGHALGEAALAVVVVAGQIHE